MKLSPLPPLVLPVIIILATIFTLWPAATPKLPVELQLAYLEASLEVADARAALLAAQERQVAALAKANAWCPVALVGHRLECRVIATPAAMQRPVLPASSMRGGGGR